VGGRIHRDFSISTILGHPAEELNVAEPTGFEPAISGLTGRRVNQATPRLHESSALQAFLTPLQTILYDVVTGQSQLSGAPSGIWTRVTALKGRYPRPLDDGGSFIKIEGLSDPTKYYHARGGFPESSHTDLSIKRF
jgi:hypothetical protein